MTPTNLAKADFRLSFLQQKAKSPRKGLCPRLKHSANVFLRTDDVVYFAGKSIVVEPTVRLRMYPGLVFDPADGNAIRAVRVVGLVKLVPYHRNRPPRVCIVRP